MKQFAITTLSSQVVVRRWNYTLFFASLLMIGALNQTAHAQSGRQLIGIDWNNKGNTPTGLPSEVNTPLAVSIIVSNVNDVLYDYGVQLAGTPRTIDDFGKLPTFGGGSGAVANAQSMVLQGLVPSCKVQADAATSGVTDLQTVIDTKIKPVPDKDLPTTKDGTIKSIPLKETLAAWSSLIEAPMSAASQQIDSLKTRMTPISPGGCESAADWQAAHAVIDKFADLVNMLAPWRAKVSSNHQVTHDDTVQAETDYKITVTESYSSKATAASPQTYSFSPTSSILTLSAGPLFTWLPSPTYVSSTVPTSTVTHNILTVNNSSGPQIQLATLLNYRIPWPGMSKTAKAWNSAKEAGLAVSTGPVIRIGSSSSGSSAFGWFAGVSVHLWTRIYATPGVHIGQYAGIPAGFQPGQVIPPNFGQLIPTQRWTVHFAVALTFRAADLSKAASKWTTSSGSAGK
jgi:hypothetical protein